ncbi:hypothetical protein SHELI_v1c03200 [Spiroplasma helicoides]|uniref:Uncharacterized protein n=1 Tax=Spiroplasma helicoides TaxID=216938 RepID=A0A1B3SK23_9MOLU|nr:hypothetical protein [Spiroplasma helicoides]AOG60275.1 hypothetical protein SHELI_v1c03200 [Spiroplasma helicoides]
MSTTTIYSLVTLFAIIFIASLITIVSYVIILKINKSKKTNTDFVETYFIDENNKNKNWWVSKDGALEKIWLKAQDYDFKIAIFNYYENFSEGFFNSKFVKTKKLLLENSFELSEVNKIINKITKYNNCLENIWWKKYKTIFKQLSKSINEKTASPEYFFYKYYFKFIHGLRSILSNYLTLYIIPNAILLELKPTQYDKFKINTKKNLYHYIKGSFERVAKETNELYNSIINEMNEEISLKGKNWILDYQSKDDLFKELQPEYYIKKMFLREMVYKFSKVYNIPLNKSLQEAIEDLKNYLPKNEIENIYKVQDEIEKNFFV